MLTETYCSYKFTFNSHFETTKTEVKMRGLKRHSAYFHYPSTFRMFLYVKYLVYLQNSSVQSPIIES